MKSYYNLNKPEILKKHISKREALMPKDYPYEGLKEIEAWDGKEFLVRENDTRKKRDINPEIFKVRYQKEAKEILKENKNVYESQKELTPYLQNADEKSFRMAYEIVFPKLSYQDELLKEYLDSDYHMPEFSDAGIYVGYNYIEFNVDEKEIIMLEFGAKNYNDGNDEKVFYFKKEIKNNNKQISRHKYLKNEKNLFNQNNFFETRFDGLNYPVSENESEERINKRKVNPNEARYLYDKEIENKKTYQKDHLTIKELEQLIRKEIKDNAIPSKTSLE